MYCPVFQGNTGQGNFYPWYQALHPAVAVPTLPGKDPASGKDAHLICIKDENGDIPESYGNLLGVPGVTHKIVIKRDMTHSNKGIQVDIVHPSGKSMLYGGIVRCSHPELLSLTSTFSHSIWLLLCISHSVIFFFTVSEGGQLRLWTGIVTLLLLQ